MARLINGAASAENIYKNLLFVKDDKIVWSLNAAQIAVNLAGGSSRAGDDHPAKH